MSQLDPSSLPIIGPGTPYINPQILLSAPTGISWNTVPGRTATADQQYAEQVNICARSTAMVDEYCNQPLRATIDTDYFTAPGDFRVQNQPTGVTRMICTRGPVVAVIGGAVSAAAAFPRSWQDVPANQWDVEVPVAGVYGTTAPSASASGGQAVLLAPGWVTWATGRQTTRVRVNYLNGWPHASLTTAADAADSTLGVDDITGWLGACGVVYGQAMQESMLVTAVTPATSGAISGPGTLTLASPLSFPHQAGDIVSTLPGSVMQAAIFFSVMQALTRGATATAVQSLSGGVTGGGGGALSPSGLIGTAQRLLDPFKRRI